MISRPVPLSHLKQAITVNSKYSHTWVKLFHEKILNACVNENPFQRRVCLLIVIIPDISGLVNICISNWILNLGGNTLVHPRVQFVPNSFCPLYQFSPIFVSSVSLFRSMPLFVSQILYTHIWLLWCLPAKGELIAGTCRRLAGRNGAEAAYQNVGFMKYSSIKNEGTLCDHLTFRLLSINVNPGVNLKAAIESEKPWFLWSWCTCIYIIYIYELRQL